MDLVPYLSAVILIATIATIVLAIFSYAAFRLRGRRRPGTEEKPVFYRRYQPPEPGEPDGEGT